MSRRRDANQADHVSERQLGGGKRPRVTLKVLDESRAGTFEPRSDVPRTRGDCIGGQRPCPHVRCSQHLWLVDGNDRPGRRGKGYAVPPTTIEPRWLESPTPPSCALDVADDLEAQQRTGASLGEPVLSIATLGAALGRDESAVWLILRGAIEKLRATGLDLLRELAAPDIPRGFVQGCRRKGAGRI